MMKLIPQCVSTVVLAVLVGYSYGNLQEVTVSQGTFGGELGRLLAETVEALLSQKGALEPEIDSCVSKIKLLTFSCTSCIGAIECGGEPPIPILMFLEAVNTIEAAMYTSGITGSVTSLANSIASGAQAIFDFYGVDAIDAIRDGFANINHVYGSILGTGFAEALDVMTSSLDTIVDAASNIGNTVVDAGKSVGKEISSWFGKRRRRSSLSDVQIPQLTDEQKLCMEQCPDCAVFTKVVSPETAILDITGQICGSQLADTIQTITTQIGKLEKLVDDMKANVVILKELWIDTSTNTVTSFAGWKSGTYYVYHPDVTISFDVFNNMPMYKAIAAYLLDQY